MSAIANPAIPAAPGVPGTVVVPPPPRHLSMTESINEFANQIDPPGGVSIMTGGQFYWTNRLYDALYAKYTSLPATEKSAYAAYCTAHPKNVAAASTSTLDGDFNLLGNAVFGRDQALYSALLTQISKFLAANQSATNAASLLKPAVKKGVDIYTSCWNGYFASGKVLDFGDAANAHSCNYPTMSAVYAYESGACGMTAGLMAAFFTGKKRGFSRIDPGKKKSTAKSQPSLGLRASAVRDPGLRGDVLQGVATFAKAMTQLKDLLDKGYVAYARVASGLHANDMTGGDSYEHAILLVGYDGDRFVFWDPDFSASEGFGRFESGVGVLYYDAANRRLTTARNDADLAVTGAGGKHAGRDQHRYQVGLLICK